MKKTFRYAFSLVELMVTLIILSCIIAATTPTITKKLHSQSITVGSGGGQSNLEFSQDCSQWEDCALCFPDKCAMCAKECLENEYVEVSNCTCKSCNIYSNCKECTSKQCKNCEDGYFLDNLTCSSCPVGFYCDGKSKSKCESGYYQDELKQKTCKSCIDKDENCIECNNETGECITCKEKYTLVDGACKKLTKIPNSQADCTPFNALYIPAKYNGIDNIDLCVTKYNVGHANGPNIYNSGSARLVSVGVYCDNSNGYCCWGSTPVTCGYNVARESCLNWTKNNSEIGTWDLPTPNILDGWSVSYASSSEFQSLFYGSSGIGCYYENWTKQCNGSGNGENGCVMHVMWSSESTYTFHCNSTPSAATWGNQTYSLSARCVAREIPVIE